jgi:dTDP-4-amino-4,6-dideoxygalactose transaminase
VLDKRNAILKAQVRKLNDVITHFPGIYEQENRKDVDRVYYGPNRLYLNEKEAGVSRDAFLKALTAEGVQARTSGAQFLAKNPLYHEAEWWHHMPIIAARYPGVEDREKRGFLVPFFTKEMPELTDQYIKAFQKVWAHRKSLA